MNESLKWSVLFMDKYECRCNTGINFKTFFDFDLHKQLSKRLNHFADSTSLFSIVHDIITTTINLKRDLSKRCEWEVQWKMSFHSVPWKQPQELLFSQSHQG